MPVPMTAIFKRLLSAVHAPTQPNRTLRALRRTVPTNGSYVGAANLDHTEG